MNAYATENAMLTEKCIECHKEVYEKALDYKYKHSFVLTKCPECHVNKEGNDILKWQRTLSSFIDRRIVYIDELTLDRAYTIYVSGTDSVGNDSATNKVELDPKAGIQIRSELQAYKLVKISEISVDEITKQAYVKAVIPWETNTYATTEIEYGPTGERPNRITIDPAFTKKHEVVLERLRHKRKYFYRVISTDIYGNTLKSGDYEIDTTDAISRTYIPELSKDVLPVVNNVQIFTIEKYKGFYLQIYTNKPSEILLTIKEVADKDKNHSVELFSEKALRIDSCYACHPHGSSHPVGVKAESPKINTPQGLPTVGDGIITCLTCHKAHGGERKYFHRVDFNKALCMRCHLKKYSLD